MHTPQPGSFKGQQVKQRALYTRGIQTQFFSSGEIVPHRPPVKKRSLLAVIEEPKTVPASPSVRTSIAPVATTPSIPAERQPQETKTLCSLPLPQGGGGTATWYDPVEQLFEQLEVALKFCSYDFSQERDQCPTRELFAKHLLSVTLNSRVIQQVLHKILQLYPYSDPNVMLTLYQDFEAQVMRHNHAHQPPLSLRLEGHTFDAAIHAYRMLSHDWQQGRFSTLKTTASSSIRQSIAQSGFFKTVPSRSRAAVVLLRYLETELIQAGQQQPDLAHPHLYHLSRLPWPLCEILIPHLISYRQDAAGNTLLHQLVQHPQCSRPVLEATLKQLYAHRMARSDPKGCWQRFVSCRNHEGHDAIRVAFTAGRKDLCQLLHQYSIPHNAPGAVTPCLTPSLVFS